jgi:hypothetical protein
MLLSLGKHGSQNKISKLNPPRNKRMRVQLFFNAILCYYSTGGNAIEFWWNTPGQITKVGSLEESDQIHNTHIY